MKGRASRCVRGKWFGFFKRSSTPAAKRHLQEENGRERERRVEKKKERWEKMKNQMGMILRILCKKCPFFPCFFLRHKQKARLYDRPPWPFFTRWDLMWSVLKGQVDPLLVTRCCSASSVVKVTLATFCAPHKMLPRQWCCLTPQRIEITNRIYQWQTS